MMKTKIIYVLFYFQIIEIIKKNTFRSFTIIVDHQNYSFLSLDDFNDHTKQKCYGFPNRLQYKATNNFFFYLNDSR